MLVGLNRCKIESLRIVSKEPGGHPDLVDLFLVDRIVEKLPRITVVDKRKVIVCPVDRPVIVKRNALLENFFKGILLLFDCDIEVNNLLVSTNRVKVKVQL